MESHERLGPCPHVSSVEHQIQPRRPEDEVRGPGGEAGREERVVAQRAEDSQHGPVDDRDHDRDADPVERAASRHHERERHRQQRHHEAHHREGQLAVQLHAQLDHVEAARLERGDVGAQLAEAHGVRRLLLALEVGRPLELTARVLSDRPHELVLEGLERRRRARGAAPAVVELVGLACGVPEGAHREQPLAQLPAGRVDVVDREPVDRELAHAAALGTASARRPLALHDVVEVVEAAVAREHPALLELVRRLCRPALDHVAVQERQLAGVGQHPLLRDVE